MASTFSCLSLLVLLLFVASPTFASPIGPAVKLALANKVSSSQGTETLPAVNLHAVDLRTQQRLLHTDKQVGNVASHQLFEDDDEDEDDETMATPAIVVPTVPGEPMTMPSMEPGTVGDTEKAMPSAMPLVGEEEEEDDDDTDMMTQMPMMSMPMTMETAMPSMSVPVIPVPLPMPTTDTEEDMDAMATMAMTVVPEIMMPTDTPPMAMPSVDVMPETTTPMMVTTMPTESTMAMPSMETEPTETPAATATVMATVEAAEPTEMAIPTPMPSAVVTTSTMPAEVMPSAGVEDEEDDRGFILPPLPTVTVTAEMSMVPEMPMPSATSVSEVDDDDAVVAMTTPGMMEDIPLFMTPAPDMMTTTSTPMASMEMMPMVPTMEADAEDIEATPVSAMTTPAIDDDSMLLLPSTSPDLAIDGDGDESPAPFGDDLQPSISPSDGDDDAVCVDHTYVLKTHDAHQLVHKQHVYAPVLCPTGLQNGLPCATRFHMVHVNGADMSYEQLCERINGGCVKTSMYVNSVLSHVWDEGLTQEHVGGKHTFRYKLKGGVDDDVEVRLGMYDVRHPKSLQRWIHRAVQLKRNVIG